MEPTRQEFLHISQTEKYLFYALIYFSLALMAWQIWGRAKVWMQGKPIWWGVKQVPTEGGEEAKKPKLSLPSFKDVGRWTQNIWSFAILQRKVKSSRKRSGAPMHLMIFYGFLALFIATSILAVNTYGPYNFHKGAFYLVYEFTFDLLGLLFVIGIGWAFFRRAGWKAAGEALVAKLKGETPPDSPMTHQFVDIRRNPLSHNLNDFLTLALLFTEGVTGYVLEGARIAINPQGWDTASFVGYGLS